MSLRNWKITAHLCSPLAGDPPKLDALLEYQLAARMGMTHSKKLTRDIPLSTITRPPIPVARRDLDGGTVYCISDPILPKPSDEWIEHGNKRFDGNKLALALAPEWRKNLLVASGPYKMRHAPVRVRLIPSISWLVRGDRSEMNKLLKRTPALGLKTAHGYGWMAGWDYEEVEEDNSIFAECRGYRVLMRTVPDGSHLQGVTGFKRSFGSFAPPYWHPERFADIAVPC